MKLVNFNSTIAEFKINSLNQIFRAFETLARHDYISSYMKMKKIIFQFFFRLKT